MATTAPPEPQDLVEAPLAAVVPDGERAARTSPLSQFRPSVLGGGESLFPVALLTVIMLLDKYNNAALGILLPEIRDYLGVSLTLLITVSTFTGLLPLLFSVPIGFLSDRTRRTWLVGFGFFLSGLFSSGTAFATSVVFLAVMRVGAGFGSVFEAGTQSLLADYYRPDRRAAIYSINSLATPLASTIGPVTAGFLAARYGWQVPLLVGGIPTVLLALVIVTRLKEPVRGAHERRAMGADEAVANQEEQPPGWSEGWRIAKNVRTLRRIWAALPFIVGVIVVGTGLQYFLLAEELGASTSQLGVIASVQNGLALVAILVAMPFISRQLERSPARLVGIAGGLAAVQALCFLLVAISPNLWVAAAVGSLSAMAGAPIAPTMAALISVTCTPRARGFAQSFGILFIAIGVAFAPFFGMVSDTYGLRPAMALLAPVFLIGAFIVASAGPSVAADIRAATAAAMASHISRKAREAGRTKLLVCRDLDAGYGQVQILFGVDFEVEEGEIIALLGTNGAGKSTLLNAISGVNPASNGAIVYDGDEITYLPASEHVGRGIVSMPGGKGVFPTLTVAENLKLAVWGVEEDHGTAARLEQVFAFFPRLEERIREPAGNLSGGEQQMLSLAQAFLARPRLLMIDELSLGLAPAVVGQLLDIVRAIHAQGTTIILVEQSVNIALEVATRAVFMEKGEVRFSGPARDLLDRGDVLRSVFLAGSASAGGSFGSRKQVSGEQDRPARGDVVLRVAGITRSFGGVQALTGVDLELRAGETLGIVGPNGAGKTTLFDVISGLVAPDRGTIELLGEDVTFLAADERARRGLGRSFQDAKLFPALTVEENLLVALDRHAKVRNLGLEALGLPQVRKSEAALRKKAERLIRLLGVEDFRDKFVAELSTGSRRLVDLACVLAADPEVLLLDEPSSGIAQKETEEMPALLERIKFEAGCSVLIIEHDMQLLTAVSDELLAMELGHDVVRGTAEDVLSHPQVVAAYLGNSKAAINRSGQD